MFNWRSRQGRCRCISLLSLNMSARRIGEYRFVYLKSKSNFCQLNFVVASNILRATLGCLAHWPISSLAFEISHTVENPYGPIPGISPLFWIQYTSNSVPERKASKNVLSGVTSLISSGLCCLPSVEMLSSDQVRLCRDTFLAARTTAMQTSD